MVPEKSYRHAVTVDQDENKSVAVVLWSVSHPKPTEGSSESPPSTSSNEKFLPLLASSFDSMFWLYLESCRARSLQRRVAA